MLTPYTKKKKIAEKNIIKTLLKGGMEYLKPEDKEGGGKGSWRKKGQVGSSEQEVFNLGKGGAGNESGKTGRLENP